MLTLYSFGRRFGLPDPSPFVTKAEVLLKTAGLPYRLDTAGFSKAPKGKLPYIRDADGTIVADSTLIRLYLERRHGIDFDAGLSPAQRGHAWMIEKFCEDHLYWHIVRERWLDDANFDKGPRHYFDTVPWPVRALVARKVRRDTGKALWRQGTGRHSAPEIEAILDRDIAALSAALGDKPFLMGDTPCGADATVFAFTQSLLCPHFDGPGRRIAERFEALSAYVARGRDRWYPDLAAA